MRNRIREHLARLTAGLSDVWRVLVCHVQGSLAEARKLSWEDLRRGFSFNFAMTLVNLALFTYFVWGSTILTGCMTA